MLNKLRVSLFFGVMAAMVHFVWALLVAAGAAQTYVNWITDMHFIKTGFVVQTLDPVKALALVVLAFVVGMVGGYILSTVCNLIVGKKK
jgi:hypothetical protein